jgi:hypothetical protein
MGLEEMWDRATQKIVGPRPFGSSYASGWLGNADEFTAGGGSLNGQHD